MTSSVVQNCLPLMVQKIVLESFNNFSIEPTEYCLTGGVVFYYWRFRTYNDIDVSLSSKAREKLNLGLSESKTVFPGGGDFCGNHNDLLPRIEINRKNVFDCLGISDDQLVYNSKYHFFMNGFKVIRLELQYSRKLYRCTSFKLCRNKDLNDVLLVERNICRIHNWDSSLVVKPSSFIDRLMLSLIRFPRTFSR